jgi:hypothetical protein
MLTKDIFYLPIILACITIFTACTSSDADLENEQQLETEAAQDEDLDSDLTHGYFKQNGQIYYQEELVKGADAASFEVLDENYSKDKRAVYVAGKMLTNSDPQSFEILNYSQDYIADNNYIENIYNQMPKIKYAKDHNQVYYYNQILKSADPLTFEALLLNYAKDQKQVYMGPYIASENVDPGSLKFINWLVYRDKRGIYCFQKKINDNPNAKLQVLYFPFLLIDGKIFACNEGAIENADLETFRPINLITENGKVLSYGYAKDQNSIYWMNKVIKGADRESFEPLYFTYSQDKNNIYFEDKPLVGVDRNTFDPVLLDDIGLPTVYSEDKDNLYYQEKVIEGADHNSFKIDQNGYAIDRDHIFFEDQIIEGADPETYQYLGIKDLGIGRKACFREECIFCAQDQNMVYCNGEPAPEVDPDDFQDF